MTFCRLAVLCLLGVLTLTITAERSVYAQAGTFFDCYEYVRDFEPNANMFQTYAVTITKTPLHYLGIGVPEYSGVLFENYEPCGNAAHKTLYDSSGIANSSGTSRCFKHIHVTYEHPIHGIDHYGNIHLVSESNVEAFWHDHFTVLFGTNWTYYGGITPKVNCWGYAFGYSTWVESPTLIYNNDYEEVTVFAVESGDLIERTGHVIVMTEVDDYPMSGPMWTPGMRMVTKTRERNRSSGVYEFVWTPSDQPAGYFHQKKN